jgi:hypothetical protein
MIRAVKATNLKKGDVIALPFGKTATVLDTPKIGRTFVNFTTEYGKRRLELNYEVTLEVPGVQP